MKYNQRFTTLIFLILCSLSYFRSEAQMITEGLVAYWPLDQGTIEGKKVKDMIGENHGEMVGNGKIKAGKIGQAFECDGDDSVDIPGSKTLEFNGKKSMTVAAWVKAKNKLPVKGVVAGCCGTIVAQRDAAGWAFRFDGRNAGAEIEFITCPGWQGDAGFGAPKFAPNEWHYITGVIDNKKKFLYVDGKLVKEADYNGPMKSNSSETEIGKAQDGGFIGLIDEVTIYNRALSADEIQVNLKAKGLVIDPKGKLSTSWSLLKAGL